MEAHASPQSHVDPAHEYHIAYQIQALHELIGEKLFTHELVSEVHHQLFRPSSSTSHQNEILERYIKSLSTAEEHRLNSEIRIYDYTGQISTFFVRDQELDALETDKMFLIVDEWVSSVKTVYFAPHCSKETAAYALQSKFDFFREEHGFRVWDQQKLKAMRYSLFGECAACEESTRLNPGKPSLYNLLSLQLTWKTVSSGATGMIHDQMTRRNQKTSLGSDTFHPYNIDTIANMKIEEPSPGKRARSFNSLYDTNPERKKVCLVSRETDSQGVTVEVREVDPAYDMDEETRSIDMDLC